MLVLVLVIIVVIGLAGAAALNQASSAPQVQNQYQQVRTKEMTVDQSVENVLTNLRTNYPQGSSVEAYNKASEKQACADHTGSFTSDANNQIATNVTIPGDPKTADIFCVPDATSGTLQGDAPAAPAQGILTLGGMSSPAQGLPYPDPNAAGGAAWSGAKEYNPRPAQLTGEDDKDFTTTGYSHYLGGAPRPDYYQPFCKDFHDFQDASGKDICEAGLFIGKSVNDAASGTNTSCTTAPCPGGLLVDNPGSLTTNQPLVETNGSIVVSKVGTNNSRELDVQGGVWARSACGFGAGVDGGGFGNPPSDVFAMWSPATPQGVTSALHCNNANSTVSPTNSNPTGGDETLSPLLPDPNYVHEPIDLSQTPIVNGATAAGTAGGDACEHSGQSAFYSAGGTAAELYANPNNWAPCSSNDCYVSTGVNAGKNKGSCQLDPNACANGASNGLLIMPAKELQDGSGNPIMQPSTINGATVNEPVFTAWYDNAADLNAMMTACSDTLIWFRPGVYYFDFQDVSGGTKAPVGVQWLSPKGCWPISSGCAPPDEMVGGSPGTLWNLCKTDGSPIATIPGTPYPDLTQPYDTKVGISNCLQPPRTMTPELVTPQNGPFSNVPAGVLIDDQSTATSICTTNKCSHGSGTLQFGDLQTPIPSDYNPLDVTQNVSTLKLLTFNLAYDTPGSKLDLNTYANSATPPDPNEVGSWYKDSGNDNYANGPGAEVEFQIQGGASCYLHLPNGPHGALDDHTTQGLPVDIDMSHGCDPAYINNAKTTNYPNGDGVWVDAVGSSFPCGGSQTDWTTDKYFQSGVHPSPTPSCWTNAPKDFITRPDLANTLRATFIVSASNTSSGSDTNHTTLAYVNGADFTVQWYGRPAPEFPGGCDRTLPGTQFIFGGAAKIAWGTAASRSMFAELCASRQDLFPTKGSDNTPVPGAGYQYQSSFCSSGPSCDFTTGNGHNFGIAVYGMTEDAAGTPPTIDTSNGTGKWAPSNFSYNAADTTQTGGPTFVNYDGSTISGNVANLANPTDPTKQISAIWNSSSWGTSTFSYNLPTNLIGYGAGQIPPGAFITQAQVIAYHREGYVQQTYPQNSIVGACGYPKISTASNASATNTYTFAQDVVNGAPHFTVGQKVWVGGAPQNGYNVANMAITAVSAPNGGPYTVSVGGAGNVGAWQLPAGGAQPAIMMTGPLPKTLPNGCTLAPNPVNASDGFNSVNVKIVPGNPGAGSNAYSASTWNTKGNGPIDGGIGFPLCTDYTAAPSSPGDGYTYNQFPQAGGNVSTDYTTGTNTVTGAAGACPFTWGNINSTIVGADSTGEDWTLQRDLTDAMSTPEGWNGAEVQLTVAAAKTTTLKESDFSGLKLLITYRGPAAASQYQPRPLMGCATTRTPWPNGYLVPSVANNVSQAAPGYDWLDHDWGTKVSTGGSAFLTDDAYGNDSANPGGTGGTADQQDCALVQVINGSSLQGATIKFHLGGMIYAPSAALDLNANDNDASWTADGIVARHLTALRWKNNGDTPAVGDDPSPRNNRSFTIYVCRAGTNCSGTGNTLSKVYVVIQDYDSNGQFIPGHNLDTVSWLRQ
jgi:hypothetical protein